MTCASLDACMLLGMHNGELVLHFLLLWNFK